MWDELVFASGRYISRGEVKPWPTPSKRISDVMFSVRLPTFSRITTLKTIYCWVPPFGKKRNPNDTLWINPYRKYATNQSNRQDGFQNLERRRPIIEHDTEPVLHQQTNSPELQAIFTIFLILIWYIHWAGTPCGNILISQVTNYWSNVLARCRLHQAKEQQLNSWSAKSSLGGELVEHHHHHQVGDPGETPEWDLHRQRQLRVRQSQGITVGNHCRSCFP